jgi:long-chain acyl-CoA synthetase
LIASGGPRNGTGHSDLVAVRCRRDVSQAQRAPGQAQRHISAISHDTLIERIRTAFGLEELGVRAGDRVAILSENCPEWAITDYACLTLGATDVPIYPNLPSDQICYILRDSGAVAIFVSTPDQAAKVAAVRAECSALRRVITFADSPAGADMTLAALETPARRWTTMRDGPRSRRARSPSGPRTSATIIYTSGTTGEPKGVMLTHDNIYSNVMVAKPAILFVGDDTCLSRRCRPSSRLGGHYMMLATGTSIAYAESVDTVPLNMTEVRPTLVLSVPRLYEKMYARVLENAVSGGAVKRRIFFWARRVADRWADVRLAGGTPRGALALQYMDSTLVSSTCKRERADGSAILCLARRSVGDQQVLYAAGLVILEGYG